MFLRCFEANKDPSKGSKESLSDIRENKTRANNRLESQSNNKSHLLHNTFVVVLLCAL